MGVWKSKNKHKYLLQYHIIFVYINAAKNILAEGLRQVV